MVDANGCVQGANESARRLCGYDEPALAGRPLRELGVSHRAGSRELDLLARDGSRRRVTARYIDSGDADVRFVQVDDLSERVEAETRYRSLFEHNPDGVIVLAADGRILEVNESTLRMSKRSADEVIGRNFREFLAGAELDRGSEFFERALNGEPITFEGRSTRGDGSPLFFDVTLVPKFAGDAVIGIYAMLQDVTERKSAERRVRMQAERIRDLYLLATTGEYSEAHVMAALQMGCRLLGMPGGAIVDAGTTVRIDTRYDTQEPVLSDSRVVELAGPILDSRDPILAPTCIGTRITLGGIVHAALLFYSSVPRLVPFDDTDRDTIALMGALVSGSLERRRSRAHLRALAYYDSLTGLPNRTFFQERLRDTLAEASDRGGRAAVLFFDLDRFKDINDTLGHALGDRFLQLVAGRLVHFTGDGATIARMGGDEFIVLVPSYDRKEQVRALADALLAAVGEPYNIEGHEQYLTTSIGIALYPDDGRDDQTLIKNADIAMYFAKHQGRNACFFYDQSLQGPLRGRLSQEKHLRKALERGEFVLHYQPIVDVATQTIVAVEALVRWNHPQYGLLRPDDFIPAAEDSGMIVPLGEWVLRTAAEQTRQWRDRFGALSLAVNISAGQFHQHDLCASLQRTLDEAGLPAQAVEIEITESMALFDAAHAIDTVRSIKRLGAHIVLDDFGTGHSSLNYLRRFAVDQIKIDRSFVAGIGNSSNDEAIVKALVAMGHSLGMTVVGEGVETAAQLAFLTANGCDRAQGHLFATPAEPAAIDRLFATPGERFSSPPKVAR